MKSSRFPGAFAAGASPGAGAVGIGSPGCFTDRHNRPPWCPMCTRSVWLSIITGAGSVSAPAGVFDVDVDVDVVVDVDGDGDVADAAPPVSFFHVSITLEGGLKQSASVSPPY